MNRSCTDTNIICIVFEVLNGQPVVQLLRKMSSNHLLSRNKAKAQLERKKDVQTHRDVMGSMLVAPMLNWSHETGCKLH